MAKVKVTRDKGVRIGERFYPHGAVVDTERVVEEPKPLAPLKADATEEEKRQRAELEATNEKRAEQRAVQAEKDLKSHTDEGFLVEHTEAATEPPGKEE